LFTQHVVFCRPDYPAENILKYCNELYLLAVRPVERWPRASKVFFSEEKTQKTLRIQVVVPPEREATALAKVFWFFSTEKNAFLVPRATWARVTPGLQQPVGIEDPVFGRTLNVLPY
jgi:hypothetical protein